MDVQKNNQLTSNPKNFQSSINPWIGKEKLTNRSVNKRQEYRKQVREHPTYYVCPRLLY